MPEVSQAIAGESAACRESPLTSRRVLPVIGAGVFLLAFTGAVFHELVQQPAGLLVGSHGSGQNDLTLQFLRFRDTPAQLMRQSGEFRIPGWDPHLGLGMPVHGNPQMALFYPPNWLCFVFGATQTISWLLVAHMFLAGLGAWFLARAAQLSWVSCLFAGAAATGMPYCVAHLAEGHVAQICAVTWFPWILYSFERFLASDGRNWKAVSFCLAMSFLAGHVQEPYYLALLLSGAVVVSSLTRMKKGEPGAGSLLAHWSVAGVVTIALVAVDLVPVYLNSLETGRGTRLPLQQAGHGLQLENLRQLINPFALGRPGDGGGVETFYWTRLLYFGVVPLILAVIGLVVGFRRPHGRRLTILLTVSLLFALGTVTPLYELCWRYVPMIGSFRIPSRILFICSYCMAMLASVGLDALIAKRDVRPHAEPGTPAPGPSQVTMAGALSGVLLLAVAGAELGWHAREVIDVAPPESLRQSSVISRFLSSQPGRYRVQTTHNLYSDYEALRDNTEKLRGYEPVVQLRLACLLDAISSAPDEQIDFGGFRETRLSEMHDGVMDIAGVRYLITSERQVVREGWQLVGSGKVSPLIDEINDQKALQFGVYENLDVMPRAFVVGNVVETSGSALQATIASLEKIDPRRAVLLEHDVLPPGPRSDYHAAEIVEALPDRVTVRAQLDQPGYLVLADLFHPGWKATVNGRTAKVLPADIAFRAVALTPGENEVVFKYECPGQKAGLLLSGAMLGMLVLAGVIGLVRTWSSSQKQGALADCKTSR